MNIGIDAYYLYSTENTGIGYYVLNLLIGLSRVDKKNKYFLYTPPVRDSRYTGIILENKNFHIVECDNAAKKFKRLWLQHPSVKKRIREDNLDLFLGGGEHIPLFFRSRTVFCLTIHDVVFKIYPETVSAVNKFFCNTLLVLCARKAGYIFTVSETSKKEIVQHLHIEPSVISAIPNGIDLEKYRPSSKTRKGDYILFVGTIQPRKNLVNLIKAFSLIHNDIQERLVIVGASGWKNSSLINYIRELPAPIRERIEFKGYVGEEELLTLYREARLFAAPSLHEGFGIIILEAMASGTPVVASATGAISEYFSGAALLADPLSPEDIGKKMLKVLKSGKLQNDMIRKGIAAAERFGVEKVARQYIRAFSEIEKREMLKKKKG